ncbi:MAG: hypothetical protein ACJ75J_16715 [Cytophagaceae bacterium]
MLKAGITYQAGGADTREGQTIGEYFTIYYRAHQFIYVNTKIFNSEEKEETREMDESQMRTFLREDSYFKSMQIVDHMYDYLLLIWTNPNH